LIIVLLSRKAFSNLEKTIEKLNEEIRKAVDDITQ
jgi:flagellar basal body-associated protein FliL